MPQQAKMIYDPWTREKGPVPAFAAAYRAAHGPRPWQYNPWTGAARTFAQTAADWHGLQLSPADDAHSEEQRATLQELLKDCERLNRAELPARVIDADRYIVEVVKTNYNHALRARFDLRAQADREQFKQLVKTAAPLDYAASYEDM